MASNDYDDLLESFMNNSQKVYNDDKNAVEGKLPSSYNTFSTSDNKTSKNTKKAGTGSGRKRVKSQKSPANKFFSTLGKVLLAMIMIVGVVGIVCVSVIAIYGYSVVHGDPSFDLTDEKFSQNQTSFIYGYDEDNKPVEITRLHGEENRIWLDKSEMTEYLPKAFIAAEDQRFESHHGVDWIRTIGVMVKPENSGQGGSTITQQLIKNLTDENDVTFVRKFNEILSALNIEKHYNKDEIIEAYLNTIYLSHGCYGVKTAAETYFGKDVKDLNIAECACLTAITQFPSKYDPLINPENNKSRREWIIDEMLRQGAITQQQHDEAIKYKMIFTNSKEYKGSKVSDKKSNKNKNKINSYYTDYVISQVIDDLQKMGYSPKKAKNMIYGGGLKIYSAIDFDVQSAIEDVYVNYRKMPDESVQGACVVMDYKGRILGLVGGTGKKKADRTLNRATQSKRQPGSTIKPLSVYGPALEKGLTDENTEIYWSTPSKDAPLMKIDGKPWPTNDGGGYSGSFIPLQLGLAKSKNTISAQTLDKIGITYSYDFITNRFHISTLVDGIDNNYAPLATGSVNKGVTLLDMATAYQAFGNGGYYYEGYSYYKITDAQDNVIIEKTPEKDKESALSVNTAWVMNKMMQTVLTQGTGVRFKLSNIECYGKTGTTTDNKDKWFIGGTPEYLGGVWYGYDQPKTIRYGLSSNPGGTLWNLVMKTIYEKKGVKVREFDCTDEIVHREYNPYDGKLLSGTGSWGWFDKNNLPSRSTSGYSRPSSNDGGRKTTKGNGGETSSAANSSETTQASTQPQASPQEPSEPATAAKPDENE